MKGSSMMVSTLVMGAIAITLVIIGHYRGQGESIQGIKTGFWMLVSLLPLLVFAFMVAGMAQALIPREFIVHWIGEGSGLRGVLVGTAAGALTPGGPFVSFPLAAGLMGAGACIGPLVAFITGWLLLSVTRLPLEVGILGWKLTLARIACTFFVPTLAGYLAHLIFDCQGLIKFGK